MPHADPIVRAEYNKRYREENRERLSVMSKKWRASLTVEEMRSKKRAEYEKHKEDYLRRSREHWNKHAERYKALLSTPEYREGINAARRAAYVPRQRPEPKTREHILADKRSEYQRNKERYRASMKAYYLNHKEKYAEYASRKEYWQLKFERGLKNATNKGGSILDLEAIRLFYKNTYSQTAAICEYCRGLFPIRQIIVEHKQTFKLGGCHAVFNFAVTCNPCNLRKGVTPYDKWIAALGQENK